MGRAQYEKCSDADGYTTPLPRLEQEQRGGRMERGGDGCASAQEEGSEQMTSGREHTCESWHVREHGELKVLPLNQERWEREIPNTFKASSTLF